MTTDSDRRMLAAQLKALGLATGDVVLVQASMRKVAPEAGRTATVVEALHDVVGRAGTIVVPTYTEWNSTTSRAHRAAIAGLTSQEADQYRRSLPGFDRRTTPSSGMGALAEAVRTHPTAYRSAHPQSSFAAVGRLARELTGIHDLDCHLGLRSPLGALYRTDARVLLLGVGYDVCTAFHLAEYHSGVRHTRAYECRIAGLPGDGWAKFDDIELDDTEFGRIGTEFEAAGGPVSVGRTGQAESRLFPVRDAVDFAGLWMRQHVANAA